MDNNKLVTVVIHFGSACDGADAVISSIGNQTYKQLQVICAADHSACSEVNEAINRYGDERFSLLECRDTLKTTAFNAGLSAAEGEYVFFLSAGDECSSELIESACRKLEETDGDLVLFDYGVEKGGGKSDRTRPFSEKGDPAKEKVKAFKTADYCCAVFRRSFLSDNGLEFTPSEGQDYDDVFFMPACIALSENIAYVGKQLITAAGRQNDLSGDALMSFLDYRKKNADQALHMTGDKLRDEGIRNAFTYNVLLNSIDPFIKELVNYDDPVAHDYYQWLHEAAMQLDESALKYCRSDSIVYRFLGILKTYSADEYLDLVNRKIYISLTSYPARLGKAGECIRTVLNQTKKSDGILLWLAEEEYPNGFADVPDDILEMHEAQLITIRWCQKNLKPHKKYYYAFREYPDDLIVTVDDDLKYKDDLLITLFLSYLEHPKAVSALRTHLMCFDEDRILLPYRLWIKNSNVCVNEESMQLMATTGAGTIFLPRLLDPVMFNTDAIENSCINADDLWLKCVELISDVPVVQAAQARDLIYVDGTQDVGLWSTVNKFENDETLQQITEWLDENVESGLLYRRMTSSEPGKDMMLAENIYEGVIKDRKILLKKQAQLEKELSKEKKKLKQTSKELKQAKKELEQKKKSSASAQTSTLQRKVKRLLKNI